MANGINDLIDFIRRRMDSGIIYEPRGFFDSIELSQNAGGGDGPNTNYAAVANNPAINLIAQRTPGHPEVFINGEQFPVVLTHAAFATHYLDQNDAIDDERQIQHIGVRFKDMHETYYINKWAFPAPSWCNKATAASDAGSFGHSHWRFNDGKKVAVNGGGCFVLKERDTISVDVSVTAAPAYPLVATIAFTGVGMFTYRPYMLSSTTTFTTALGAGQTITLSPNDFRNDGIEPILVTDMMCNIDGEGDNAIIGDIRRLNINVRCIGTGTGGFWFHGPKELVVIDRCPATLVGITTGRAVIHEFPEPYIWQPGDGIIVEANGILGGDITDDYPDSTLDVGLFGYIELS